MWSLPNIHRLNEEASRLAILNSNKTEKQLCRGERCERCDNKAVHATPWYDVFSDDPKGYIYQCKKHSMEGLPEGYFYCDRCGRDFIENYTWEYYFHDDPETCERICLNCALDDEINNDENWVKVEVILDKSQRTDQYSSATFLYNSGIPTKIDAQHAIAHNKVMIIDGETVITGSFNFTKAAEENNAENLLIIHDKKLAKRYIKNWQEHAGHSEVYTGRR